MGPRPKGVRIAEKEAPQKEVGRKKGVREDDGFAFTCAVCNDFGELLCCERCRDGFHLFCLGFNELPDIDPWLCSNCSDNKVCCPFFTVDFCCSSFFPLPFDDYLGNARCLCEKQITLKSSDKHKYEMALLRFLKRKILNSRPCTFWNLVIFECPQIGQ